jgi:hypothetical protein
MAAAKLNLYQKLLEIQKEVIGLGKDGTGNSYKYVTGTKVLSAIKPLMNKYGLLLKTEVLSIENTRQDYRVGVNAQNPEGRPKSEILSKLMMKFTWVDCDTGEKDENLFGANGQNDWDKGCGSAYTYGERYFMLKYFHIATDEDDIDNPERKAQEEAEKNMKQTALDLVKASKMDEAAKNQWTAWINSNTPAAISSQMENLNKQIAAFQS